MGSMTGAPKISAMRLMEQYERTKRGVYSGAIGYFSPDNDFDFNVVIRTLLYNSSKKYLSFQVGSAITYHADAEQEYEECLLQNMAPRLNKAQTPFHKALQYPPQKQQTLQGSPATKRVQPGTAS
jgi:anthranilate/para-aminobenzoate synthase component I